MGRVIGRNSKNLYQIEQKTGATLKVWGWNGLCIKGSPESQKRAIWEIKELVVSLEGIRTADLPCRSFTRSGLNFVM